MPYAPLVVDSDLADYAGAPYETAVVRAAEASVRAECGWHVAPVITETITLEARHPVILPLPTLKLVSVTTITDPNSQTVTGWTVRRNTVVAGSTLFVPGSLYSVQFSHGFAIGAQEDLAPVVAARCQRLTADALVTQASETVGRRTSSESYSVERLEAESQEAVTLSWYRLPSRRHVSSGRRS